MNTAIRWLTVGLIVLGLGQTPALVTGIANNLGGIALARVALHDTARITDAQVITTWFRIVPNRSAELRIMSAWLGTLPPRTLSGFTDTTADYVWMRQLANLRLAVTIADQAEHIGAFDHAHALHLIGSSLLETLAQTTPTPLVHTRGTKNLYWLIALSQKTQRHDLAEYWVELVQIYFPDASYAYLHSLTDPYGQSFLATVYAERGWMEDAVRVGEQALARHNWDWGHYLIAGYYRVLEQPTLAEQHYNSAIALAKSDPAVGRYRLDLAQFYRTYNQRNLAIAQVCQALAPLSSRGELIAQGQTELAKLGASLETCHLESR